MKMLEDPSNLFVVELASRSSENAGVSQHMQVMCCLFLGCIFESFPKSDSAGSEGLSRNSVLGMIDSKIGLSRFSDLIKLPTLVKPARQQNSENGNYFSFSDDPDDIYFVEAYETFYKGQVHAIKKAIYDFYSGCGDEGVENDNLSAEAKIIKMQTETISELEMELTAIKSNVSENTTVPTCTDDSCTTVNDLQAKLDEKETENAVLRMNDTELRDQLCALSAQLNDLQEKYEDAELKRSPQDDVANNSALVLQTQLDSAELLVSKLELENTRLLEQERTLSVERSHLQSELSGKDTEIVHLKAEVLSLVEIRKSMTEDAAAVQRRLQLLEEDLKSPMPFEKLNEHKIDELEKRNADLKTQIWEMESSIKTMQSTFAAESKSAQEAAIDLINLLDAEVEKPDMQNFHDVLEVCGDVICRMAGHCSDIAESFDISFDSVEGKPRARVIECIDKLSECIRCNEMKILEGERFRSQLDAAEAELERVQEDYDAAFTRLCAVEEENANLSIANNKLFEGQSSRESVDIPGECSVTNGSVPETSEKLISELELKVTDLEMDLAAALRENEKLAHSHRELEVSTKYDREESKAAKDLASIEINRLLSENDKIKNLTAEHSDCSSKITELTVELNHYKGEYSRLLEENSANLALTSKLTQEYEQLQLDCDDRKKDYTSVESMSAMLEELRSDFRRLTEHSDALQHQKREVECRLNEHVNEHQQITSDNMQMRETIAAKADEYSSLLEKFIAQKEALVTASAEAELLKSKLDEQSLATDTTADIDSTAAGKIAGLNDVIRGLELEVDELCSEKEKLSSYYTSELQRVREDVEKLSQDANTRDDELAAAKREIATLQYGMRLESNTPDTVLAVGRRLAKLMKETVGGDGHSSYEESERVEALMNSSDSELLDTVNAMDRCLDVIFVQLKASAKSKEVPFLLFVICIYDLL
jgi:chromosome segregation ATPase